MQPAVDTALKTIAEQARLMHERMLQAGQSQLSELSARLQASATGSQSEQAAQNQQQQLAWTQSLIILYSYTRVSGVGVYL